MAMTWREFEVPDASSAATVERIVAAAQHEIIAEGVLGFRTLSVARRANCNISMIYRHFIDRDHLIAHTLGEIFSRLLHDYVDGITAELASHDRITSGYLVDLLPSLDDIDRNPNSRLWLMAVAMSSESDDLKAKITSTLAEVSKKWETFFDMVHERLDDPLSIDLRVFKMVLKMNLMYYNSLFGDLRTNDVEYKAYITELLKRPATEVSGL